MIFKFLNNKMIKYNKFNRSKLIIKKYFNILVCNLKLKMYLIYYMMYQIKNKYKEELK